MACRRAILFTMLTCLVSLQLERFENMPELRRYAVSHHATLTLIDLLFSGDPTSQSRRLGYLPTTVCTPRVIELVLRMVNAIVSDDNDMKVCVRRDASDSPTASRTVTESLLRVFSPCCFCRRRVVRMVQEALALVGVLPAVVQYASPKNSTAVRYQVS